VDDKARLPETIEIDEYGKINKLRTIGDKWSYLQRHKFGANAQPFYILLDNAGKPLVPSRAYNKNIEAYIDFLKQGIKQYKKIRDSYERIGFDTTIPDLQEQQTIRNEQENCLRKSSTKRSKLMPENS
jgi:hypothetical protein